MRDNRRAIQAVHRAVWLSGVRLGSADCNARLLSDFLERNASPQLYLVGDVLETGAARSRGAWSADHFRVIRQVLAMAASGTVVHCLPGNHDEFARRFLRRTLRSKVRVCDELVHTTADGRRLLVTHGRQFQAVASWHPGVALAARVAYDALRWGDEWLNRRRSPHRGGHDSTWARDLQGKVTALAQQLADFDRLAYAECRSRGLDGIVSGGHSHPATSRAIRGGVMAYPCADWVDSCTALAEDFHGRVSPLHAAA